MHCKETTDYILPLVTRSGGTVEILLNANPLQDEAGNITGVLRDHRVTVGKAFDAEGLPRGVFRQVVDEFLPLKFAIRVGRAIWKFHVMVDRGDMFGGNANLDHLNVVRGIKHTVPNFWGLDHAVSSVQPERLALIFIDEVYPSFIAKDQLKADGMIVHHVWHWAAVWNANMRRDY